MLVFCGLLVCFRSYIFVRAPFVQPDVKKYFTGEGRPDFGTHCFSSFDFGCDPCGVSQFAWRALIFFVSFFSQEMIDAMVDETLAPF